MIQFADSNRRSISWNSETSKFLEKGMGFTDHVSLTRELRRRESYLAEAQRLSHTGSFGWRVSSGEIFWSDETFRIFEFSPSSKVSMPMILERVHPQDVPSVEMAIGAAARGEGIDLEHRLVMPDKRIKYVHVVGSAESGEAGDIELIGAVMDITARKLTEIELRRNEAYLAEAQRLSHTGSFGCKASSGEMFWSEETFQIFGYDRDAKPCVEAILKRVHPDDQAMVQGQISHATSHRKDCDLEYRLLLPDDSVKYVHVVAHAVKDKAGNLEFVGAVTDITKRKTTERGLRSSEEYLAESQKMSQTGSWAWSAATGGPSYWSEECYRVLGFDPTDGLPQGEDFFQRIHSDDRPGFRDLAETSIREKAGFEADYRVVHPDGCVRDVHVIAHPVLSTDGDLVEFVGTVIDVTERKRAEEELRRSEMELRQVLDLTPQLIAVFGPNRERLHINRIALDYLGLSLEEWRQTPHPGAFVHPDDRLRDLDYFDRAVSTGSSYELELRLRKSDGSYRWFLARSNPVFDDKGKLVRWYVASTDVEDRKRSEERMQQENFVLREEIDKASMFEEIIGISPALQAVLSRVSKVAPCDSMVLITGETGTGKELVARAIHRRSRRASRAFVSVNCAAIPRDLIASELFGHERGAFTGALQRRIGRFELAEGGTLFLDEVGELAADTQVALLRVLQEREFERVGGRQTIRADVRIIAATNRDLTAAVASGIFRQDLYYRLNVFPVEMPPLRERRKDIPLLVGYFVERYARKAGRNIKSVEQKTLQLLQSYPWPGNIRELQNVIERSVIVCETENFSVDESWLSQQPRSKRAGCKLHLSQVLAATEKEVIEEALRESQGRVFGPSGAAVKLGIARSTLESKIRSLNISKKRFQAELGR
jgi:PAS domain S-box-containing protein